jgi:ABC-2 type transport system permease protein
MKKEIIRFIRIWIQTLLPPVITMSLYFIIFGKLIGSQIQHINGFSYIQYIVPGLVMMSVITNAYSNVVSSFYGARFQRCIDEILVAPMPNYLLLLGFVTGGVARGILVGLTVTLVSLAFTHLTIKHVVLTFSVVLLAATAFSLAGFTNGLFARKFDDISIVPTFILTPLTYLGGVFYSISALPEPWHSISLFNPILYMVNAFKAGILGISDINIHLAIAMLMSLVISLWCINIGLLHKGIGLRT